MRLRKSVHRACSHLAVKLRKSTALIESIVCSELNASKIAYKQAMSPLRSPPICYVRTESSPLNTES